MLFDKELITFLSSTKPTEAKTFYKDKLGLMFLSEDESVVEFRANGILLRILIVDDLMTQPFPVLGWRVKDVSEIVKALNKKGIFCERYEFLRQNKLGIWTSRDGLRVAWFKDPDGNILSISE